MAPRIEYIDLTVDDPIEIDGNISDTFYDGSVKMTCNRFLAKQENSIDFDELIGNTSDIKHILLSAYCIDEEWLLQKLGQVPAVTLVAHWDRQSGCQGTFQHPIYPNVTMAFPEFAKFPTYGVMHSKLILIFRETGLRVVVSTANLVPYDYSEVQNAVFVQDLPNRNEKTSHSTCQFKTELARVLQRFGIPAAPALQQYDWSRMKALLISSEPGYSFSEGPVPLGLAALRKFSKKWAIDSAKASVEYQGSSLGKIDRPWLESFLACSSNALNFQVSGNVFERFRIVFPTLKSVLQSPLGPGAFGTIFCKSKDWENNPKVSFRACISTGIPGRPLHTKLMTVSEGEKPIYHYVGSANFTAAAWGRFVKDGRQLMICNFELGVLLDAHDYSINWPYEKPAPAYASDDSPWIQEMFL